MKRLIIILGFIAYSNSSFSQNAEKNTTGTPPDASAMLDVVVSDKGLCISLLAYRPPYFYMFR